MHGGKNSRECELAGTDVTPDDVSDDDVTSPQPMLAASRHPARDPHKSCRWCGYRHAPGRASCPAQHATCVACGKPGHFKRRCRSSGKREAGKAVNSVTVGAAGIAPEPLLQVQLVPQVGGQACTTTAVADTGAQVCVAGPALMSSLGLRPALLQRRAGLRDLAKIPLASLGAAPCHISLPGRSTLQEVHFVKSVERLYLSCTACKELRLVHSGFPHPQSYVAAAETTEGLSDCPPTRPSSLPLPPLEENIPRLEEWLLGQFSSTAFNTDRNPLPVMEAAPVSRAATLAVAPRPAYGVDVLFLYQSIKADNGSWRLFSQAL
ncbi:hypothetical protein O3P69_000382 [Scylla paramamosain]|uniref:CCHC-type domain-containing protein n=1 Tax=Scylla paramamosain TaxID=85552 RepID=A0AAW0UTI9_SCYPA